jgi:hypothetical protein
VKEKQKQKRLKKDRKKAGETRKEWESKKGEIKHGTEEECKKAMRKERKNEEEEE